MFDPIVEVEGGKLKGNLLQTSDNVQFYSFKGIPYAKPPTGELRFAVPQPSDPWEGIRDATKDCNICAQFDNESKSVIGDEDCLYLNVYTPKLPTAGSASLPVMVYIHGGGFVFGNGTDPSLHGPDFLIRKDIVLVIFNYRLGILGFLSLDRKEAPGNMGLRDQVQALKWVQRNIDQFAGDPNNVTIFGVSAGGASVEYLMLSPMAKGLFQKSIAQSGSSLLHWAQNDRRKIQKLARKIPQMSGEIISEDELLDYLKKLPTEDLISFSMAVLATAEFRGSINFSFVPTVEKLGDWEPFLDKSTYEILSKGEFTHVPFITGFCEREGLLAVTLGGPIFKKLLEEKVFVNHFPFDLDPVEKDEIEIKLKNIYSQEKSRSKDADAFAIDFFTDVDFLGGIYEAAKLIAKYKVPVYVYEFCYDGALNFIKKYWKVNRNGAAHGDDGGYLLKCDKLDGKLSDTDVFVQNTLLELWTNFAKYGNPTPKTDECIKTKWEPFSETVPSRLIIDKNISMKYEFYTERMKLYDELYKRKFGGK